MDFSEFKTCRHELSRPLLIITGSKGSLACGYLNLATFEKFDEAVAIVRGVNDFNDMAAAEVQDVSPAAARLGIQPGMTGEQAIGILK